MIVLLAVYVFEACGPIQSPESSTVSFEPALDTYIAHYIQTTGNIVDYDISFTSDFEDPNRLAVCTYHTTAEGDKLRYVEVLEEGFNNLKSNLERQILIDHELGHCSAGLEHNTTKHPGTDCPVSLMYPYMSTLYFCIEKRHYYYPDDGSPSVILNDLEAL